MKKIATLLAFFAILIGTAYPSFPKILDDPVFQDRMARRDKAIIYKKSVGNFIVFGSLRLPDLNPSCVVSTRTDEQEFLMVADIGDGELYINWSSSMWKITAKPQTRFLAELEFTFPDDTKVLFNSDMFNLSPTEVIIRNVEKLAIDAFIKSKTLTLKARYGDQTKVMAEISLRNSGAAVNYLSECWYAVDAVDKAERENANKPKANKPKGKELDM